MWDILNPTIPHNMLGDEQANHYDRAAIEIVRGVLTGEIPLPDELGPDAVKFITRQEMNQYENFFK
jgi:hypothetical protein